MTAALEHGARRFLARGVPAHKLVLGVPFYGYAYPCLNSGVTDDVCAIPRAAWRGVNCRCDQNALFRLRRGVLGAVKTKRLLGRSEVAGDEVQYMDVMNLLDTGACPPKLDPPAKVCNVTTPVKWDDSTSSPYLSVQQPVPLSCAAVSLLFEKKLPLHSNFLADGKLRQMWYDNPDSINLKRQIVTRLGLRGIGPYQLDSLDSNGTRTGNPRAQEESRRMWDTLSLGP